MITSASRWVTHDGSLGYIALTFSESPSSFDNFIISLKILSDGEVVDRKVALVYTSANIFTFAIELAIKEDAEEPYETLLDGFSVWQGKDKVFEFASEESDVEAPEMPKKEELPKSSFESRPIQNKILRLWNHITWTPFARKVSLSSGIPEGLNATMYTRTVTNNMLFKNCFNPANTTRDTINDLLLNPSQLYEGDNGNAFYIQEENKIVIPLSNNSSTWTEEYDYSTFMQIKGLRAENSVYFQPVESYELTTRRTEVLSNISMRHTTAYYTADIPAAFSSDISTYENSFLKQNSFLVRRLGAGRPSGLELNAGSGIIFGSDNFVGLD